MAKRDRRLKKILGREGPFGSEDMAPPVDERWVRAYLEGELSAEERADVRHLIASFRSWRDALDAVLKECGKPASNQSTED